MLFQFLPALFKFCDTLAVFMQSLFEISCPGQILVTPLKTFSARLKINDKLLNFCGLLIKDIQSTTEDRHITRKLFVCGATRFTGSPKKNIPFPCFFLTHLLSFSFPSLLNIPQSYILSFGISLPLPWHHFSGLVSHFI